jgi:hypothetical protein
VATILRRIHSKRSEAGGIFITGPVRSSARNTGLHNGMLIGIEWGLEVEIVETVDDGSAYIEVGTNVVTLTFMHESTFCDVR